jgi:hypothetical protein
MSEEEEEEEEQARAPNSVTTCLNFAPVPHIAKGQQDTFIRLTVATLYFAHN